MSTYYQRGNPNIFKDSKGNVSEVHHNHHQSIENTKLTLSEIKQEKISLFGCIAFFKAISEAKTEGPFVQATALCALEQDQALLKECEKRLKSLEKYNNDSICNLSCNMM